MYEDLLYRNFITGSNSGVLVRRKAFDRVGLFDETLLHVCDIDMWRRLAEYHNFFYIPQALVYIRKHDQNRSRNSQEMAYRHAHYIKKLERDLPERYQYHLPRVATFRFGFFAIGFLRDRQLALAWVWGLKALQHAWRCPVFTLSLIPRFLRKVLAHFRPLDETQF